MILLLHVGSMRVSEWYSGSACASLKDPCWLHAHVWYFGANGWKAGLSLDCRT